MSTSHSYANAGTYTVTLTVRDNDGATASDTAVMTITNRPPVANAGANQTGGPTAPLAFDGRGSSDPDGTITSWSWTFGDGSTGSGATVTHAYAAPGTYTVTLTVRDDDGGQSSDTAVATVTALTSGTWGARIGSTDSDAAYAVAVDATGAVFVGGTFNGTVTLGGFTLRSAGYTDWYLAKFDASGNVIWAKAFGGLSDDYLESVAVDADGDLVVVGRFGGQASLGGTALVANGPVDMAVAKYRGSDGAHIWSKRFGGAYDDNANAVAVDAAGNVYMTGYFRGVVDFGGGALRVPFDSDLDVFVTKLDPNGNHLWSKNFTNSGNDRGYGIATDGDSVAVVGSFSNAITIGTIRLVAANAMTDAFVMNLAAADGTPAWARQMGATDGNEGAYGVAIDASGNVDVCGYAIKPVDFGGGVLGALGMSDGWVASYRGTTGAHLWSRRIGGMGNDYAYSLTIAPDGGVLVAGSFEGAAGFGGATLAPVGAGDAYVAKYTSTGAPVWARQIGGNASDVGQELAVDATGHAVLAGYFYGSGVFGGSPLTSAGQADGFVTKLAP